MGVLTDKDFKKILNKKDIVIYPTIDVSQITGVGYDLTIGKIMPLSHIDCFEDDGKIIKIPPKCYCIIITEEFVWLSKKFIGTLHARGTLAAKGLFTNCTNVDPNFRGQMIMSVYNLSEVDIIINRDVNQTFITLIVHEVKNETETLVGEEGTKNSGRVLNQMLSEIYIDKSIHEKQIDNINRILQYMHQKNIEVLPKFDRLVSEAKLTLNSFNLNRLKNIATYVRTFFTGGISKLVSLTAFIICVLFLFEIVKGYFVGGALPDNRHIVLLLTSITSLIVLLTRKKD